MDLSDYMATRGDRLLRFAYLACGDAEVAEDLVQDVLCSVIERWATIAQEVEDLDAYMRRAVVNRRNSRLKRLMRERQRTRDRRDTPLAAEPSADRLELWHYLDQLTARQRTAIELSFYEDQSFSQIASLLGAGRQRRGASCTEVCSHYALHFSMMRKCNARNIRWRMIFGRLSDSRLRSGSIQAR